MRVPAAGLRRGAAPPGCQRHPSGWGIGTGYTYILAPLQAKLEELGCEFEYEMRACALIKDEAGTVIDCRFENADGEPVDIKADAVVLATGGFVDNGEMVAQYLSD